MMNDTHIDIEELERFALKSPVLSSDRLDDIGKHIALCEDCSELLRRIASFYHEIEEVDDDAISSAAIGILERSKEEREARIIELFPKQAPMELQYERPSVIALAAQDKDVLNRYAPAGTLLSSDGSTILRLTRDNDLHLYLLQVHADEPDRYAYVLVSFDCIDGEYLTNEAGEAVILQQKKISFRDAHAFIRLPRDVFHLQRVNGGNAVSGKHGHTIHIESASGRSRYRIRISDSRDNPIEAELKLAFFGGAGVKVHTSKNGSLNVDGDELNAASVAALF